jgi:hypothetical protein
MYEYDTRGRQVLTTEHCTVSGDFQEVARLRQSSLLLPLKISIKNVQSEFLLDRMYSVQKEILQTLQRWNVSCR